MYYTIILFKVMIYFLICRDAACRVTGATLTNDA